MHTFSNLFTMTHALENNYYHTCKSHTTIVDKFKIPLAHRITHLMIQTYFECLSVTLRQ